MTDLVDLRDRMRSFTADRGWDQYHDPKSLILALVGEVGELSELFQWLPSDRAGELAAVDPLRQRCAEEIADILLYLVRLADVLDVDLDAAAEEKLTASSAKHVGRRPPGCAPKVDEVSWGGGDFAGLCTPGSRLPR